MTDSEHSSSAGLHVHFRHLGHTLYTEQLMINDQVTHVVKDTLTGQMGLSGTETTLVNTTQSKHEEMQLIKESPRCNSHFDVKHVSDTYCFTAV